MGAPVNLPGRFSAASWVKAPPLLEIYSPAQRPGLPPTLIDTGWWQADAADEVGEAGVVAKTVEGAIYLKKNQQGSMITERQFE